MELTNEWYSSVEVAEILKINAQTINRNIRLGIISNIKTVNRKNFIHKDEVLKLYQEQQEKEKILKECYTLSEAAEKLGKTKGAVTNMIYRKNFTTAVNFGGKSYISKKEIHEMMDCFVGTLRVYEVAEKYNMLGSDVTYLAENNLVRAEYKNSIWYINIESLEKTLKEIEEGFLLASYKDITRRHLEAFQKGVVGISVDKASMILNLSRGTIRGYIRSGIVSAEQVGLIYYIKKSDIDKFFTTPEGIKMRYYDSKDVYRMFNEVMNCIIENNTTCKETLKLYQMWVSQKIMKSRGTIASKKLMVANHMSTAELMSEILKKDIWECEESELEYLSQSADTNSIQAYIGQFYSYMQNFKECKCHTVYNIKNINTDDKQSAKSENEIYTKKEWIQIKNYLTDIPFHIAKAKVDKKYAQCWLYALLHLSLAWRSADFLNIPSVPVEDIMRCKVEDIDLLNITYTEAQKIINSMKNRCIPLIANKNGVKANIVVVPEILKSTAAAICINEMHRKKGKWEKMFCYKRIDNSTVSKIFPDGFVKFGSKKANKTKMSYSFETAANTRGRAELAYQLQSYSRSHKVKINGLANNVTSAYLNLTNTTVDTKLVSKHLFERGVFGWQIELMLQVIDIGKNDTLQERTARIQALTKELSPMVVEGMASYINSMSNQASELVDELMLLSKKELTAKLISIARMQSPGLLKNTQCIKGATNCPYFEGEAMCLGCKYNVPTNYVLEIVNVRLNETLTLLEATPQSDRIKRMKYTNIIRKLLFILMDFRRTSKELGDDYLTSFIDLKALSQRISILEKTKFLSVGAGNNGN